MVFGFLELSKMIDNVILFYADVINKTYLEIFHTMENNYMHSFGNEIIPELKNTSPQIVFIQQHRREYIESH